MGGSDAQYQPITPEDGELDRLVHDYIKLIAAREPFA